MVEPFIQEMARKIVQVYNPECVLLFGSHAKGQATPHSDVDLLIVKDTRQPMLRRGQIAHQLFYDSLVRVDLLVYTPQELEDEMRHTDSFITSISQTWIELYRRPCKP